MTQAVLERVALPVIPPQLVQPPKPKIRLFSWKEFDRRRAAEIEACWQEICDDRLEGLLATRPLLRGDSRRTSQRRHREQRGIAHFKRPQLPPLTPEEQNILFIAAGIPLPNGDRVCETQRAACRLKVDMATLPRRVRTKKERLALRILWHIARG